MKRLILLSAGVVISLLTLLSFVRNHPKQTDIPKNPGDIVECSPLAAAFTTAVSFTPPASPSAVLTRKNIYSLSATEISSLKTGITAMKALPITNPTSWLYQAAIHGTYTTPVKPSWNTCHMSGASFFFLAWHRMYCYFFERILRAKSGDPNLTLPYWDYQTNAALHPDYRNNTPGNPLYDGSRNASMNGGGTLPASISTSINNALNELLYYDFQSDVNGPHGSVHISMGGNMVDVKTAGQDPVFWLHHCNIDRLWEVWLDKCNDRANPGDAPWLTKSYTFFDETGTAVSMTGNQIVNTATQLNYRYETKNCLKIFPWKYLLYKRYPLIKWPIPVLINKQLLKRSFREAKPEMVDNFINQRKKTKFDFARQGSPDKMIIEIESIKVDKLPQGVVEVYLNLPANEKPDPKSKSFVGLLDLFSVSHANSPKRMMAHQTKLELNASRAAHMLGLSIADLKTAELSFYVRGNNLNGREMATEANLQVGGITLAIEMVEK